MRASASAQARSERRENSVMTTSMRLNLDRGRAREGRLMQAGFFPAASLARGGAPRFSFTFLTPASCLLKSAPDLFLQSPTLGVNEKHLSHFPGRIGIIFARLPTPRGRSPARGVVSGWRRHR